MDRTSIRDFYENTSVFITGGTGFIGKILVQKLLSTTGVNILYLLVRRKNGQNISDRIENLFDEKIFTNLGPDFKSKIVLIQGDCSLPNLGLDKCDENKLINNVNIIFHIAATVKLEENLKSAFEINVNGTKEVISLAKKMALIKSIIHVSTAYSNCTHEFIEEKIYNFPMSYEQVKSLIDFCDFRDISKETCRIIGKWPNTYTFTKALAESIIKETKGGLPVSIYRPPIVLSTYKEPLEGWINNLYGPTGIFMFVMLGILRVVIADENKLSNLIPVDTCVAGLIATAWDTANNHKKSNEIFVYNHVCPAHHCLTWGDLHSIFHNFIDKNPVYKSIWTPKLIITTNYYVFIILYIIFHVIPGFVIDLYLILTGNKPRMLRTYKQIYKYTQSIYHFNRNSWSFKDNNVINLWNKLSVKDKELFPMQITDVNWLIYYRSYIKGIKKYLIKENDDYIEEAKRKQTKLKILHKSIKYLLIYLIINFILNQLL